MRRRSLDTDLNHFTKKEQSDKFEAMVPKIRTLSFAALVSFREVVATGGIAAAADRLGLAKSGVSRHIHLLEAYFGVALFERGPRSVRLTKAGAQLQDRIQSLLREAEMLSEIACEEQSAISGPVRIAATPEFGSLLTRRFLTPLAAEHPRLQLMLYPSYDFEDMQDPAIDLAFRVGSFQDDRLIARRLGEFRRVLVASPDYLSRHPIERPQDLETVPCLIFRSNTNRVNWQLTDPDGGGAPIAVSVSGPIAILSLTAIRELAQDGAGIAFLPDFMTREEIESGRLVRCLAPLTSDPLPVFLTYRPGAQKITRVACVLDAARRDVPGLLR